MPLTGINRLVIPFISCGDLSGFDSDQTYELSYPDSSTGSYQSLEATTAPVDPPYKKAKELRKEGKLNSTLGAVVIIHGNETNGEVTVENTTTATSTAETT